MMLDNFEYTITSAYKLARVCLLECEAKQGELEENNEEFLVLSKTFLACSHLISFYQAEKIAEQKENLNKLQLNEK